MAAVSSGLPVLVEKPFVLRSTEAEALAEAAEARGVALFVGHTFMYSTVVQAIAREVATGRLGKISAVRCVRSNVGTIRTDTDVVWDLAPHDLSILSLMFGWPETVYAEATRRVNGQVVAGVLVLSYENLEVEVEVEVEVELSWASQVKRRYLSLVGENATLTHDFGTGGPLHLRTSARRRSGVHVREDSEPLVVQAMSFAAAIRGEVGHRNRGTEASDGVAMVAVLEAADRSIDQRAPCRVQYDAAAPRLLQGGGEGRNGR